MAIEQSDETASSMLEAALHIAKYHPVFPCRPRDEREHKAKSPLTAAGFKSASQDPAQIRAFWRQWPDAMIGVPTGGADGIFVLDIDKKGAVDGFAALAALEAKYGQLPPTFTVETPSGGQHRVFKMPRDADIRCSVSRVGPGLDVRANDGYVIFPPSRVQDSAGKPAAAYASIGIGKVAPLPDWLVRRAVGEPKPGGPKPGASHSAGPSNWGNASWATIKLDELSKQIGGAQEGVRNDTLNKTAFCLGQILAMGKLDRSVAEGVLLAAARASGLGESEALRTIARGIEAGLVTPAERPLFVDMNWKGSLDTHSWRNVDAFLDWQGVSVLHNEFTKRNEIEGLDGYRQVTDDANRKIWDLAHQAGFRVGASFLRERLLVRGLNNRYHPVREVVDRLKWDGVPRLDKWLTTHLGAEASPYTSAVGAITMIAAVRRIRNPGAKFDQLLILEGTQGSGKSTALKLLALREECYTDCVTLTQDSKVIIEQTAGKWIVEVPELSGMKKAEVEHVKANLSRTSDRARGAYDRLAEDVPRQFIMIGTTNPDLDGTAAYLKDPTGHRRFWPVRSGAIDLEALEQDRYQLWAEAAYQEAKGESIVLAQELWPMAAAEQDKRMEHDPWHDEVEAVVGDNQGRLLVAHARKLVSSPSERWGPYQATRLGRVMTQQGFKNTQLRDEDGKRRRYYVRGDSSRELRLKIEAGECILLGVFED